MRRNEVGTKQEGPRWLVFTAREGATKLLWSGKGKSEVSLRQLQRVHLQQRKDQKGVRGAKSGGGAWTVQNCC